jgi:tetratricopeptide (TPR) repeat protein
MPAQCVDSRAPASATEKRWSEEGDGHATTMAGPTWENTYSLSDVQLEQLDEAETLMERMDLTGAETILLAMLEEEPDCVPVLSNLGHLYGKHLSEFENAVEYYDKVLEIEPDNAWARDARRRYARYIGRD